LVEDHFILRAAVVFETDLIAGSAVANVAINIVDFR